jgi:hypothetical protein
MALPDDDQSEARSSSSSSGFLLDYYYSGQILFRPNNADPFLYLVTGPAQTDGQLQARILRFRVGDTPSGGTYCVCVRHLFVFFPLAHASMHHHIVSYFVFVYSTY